jgi:hypothetical protein
MTKSIRTNDDDGKNKNILGQEKKQIGEWMNKCAWVGGSIIGWREELGIWDGLWMGWVVQIPPALLLNWRMAGIWKCVKILFFVENYF